VLNLSAKGTGLNRKPNLRKEGHEGAWWVWFLNATPEELPSKAPGSATGLIQPGAELGPSCAVSVGNGIDMSMSKRGETTAETGRSDVNEGEATGYEKTRSNGEVFDLAR